MIVRVLKILALIGAAICGLFIGQTIGPINSLSGAVLVDDNYFTITRNHFFVLGVLATLLTYMTGAALKVSCFLVSIIVMIVGGLYYTRAQIQDPDFPEFYFDGALEFMLPFILGGILIFTIFKLTEIIWHRRGNAHGS